jgi:putative membrane protein
LTLSNIQPTIELYRWRRLNSLKVKTQGFDGRRKEMCRGNRLALIIGGTVLAILLIVPVILGVVTQSGYGGWGWGMMGPRMMYGYGGGWYMGIFMVIFWGLIIWGIIALVRYFGRSQQFTARNDSALEILKRRYAQGEINKDEYEEKKKALI